MSIFYNQREGWLIRETKLAICRNLSKKCRGAYGQGGGIIITGFYGNIKGHPQDNIRVTVSEYKVYNLLLASPL